jgi:quinol monooxygenase YgiN
LSELHITTRFAIHDGQLGAFKSLASRCMEVVREKDSGTYQYDWFLNADGTECVLRERYRDSDAVLEHAANLGDLMGGFLSISVPDVEIFGTPTGALLEALAGLRPRVYSAYQSL